MCVYIYVCMCVCMLCANTLCMPSVLYPIHNIQGVPTCHITADHSAYLISPYSCALGGISGMGRPDWSSAVDSTPHARSARESWAIAIYRVPVYLSLNDESLHRCLSYWQRRRIFTHICSSGRKHVIASIDSISCSVLVSG
jgi:hypothetical protein